MKTFMVFLVIALLLIGVAADVMPSVIALNSPSDHAVPVLSIDGAAPLLRISCANEPCQCPGGDC